MKRDRLLALAVVVEGGLFLLSLALAPALNIPLWQSLRWQPAALSWGALAALPPLLALLWARRSQWSPLRRLNNLVTQTVGQIFSKSNILDMLLISVLAGLGEEALFRGLLQPWLSEIIGVWGALLLVNIVFGLVHALSPAYAVAATLIGLYFSALFLATDNLLAPAMAHALYDFGALLVIMAGRATNPPGPTDPY